MTAEGAGSKLVLVDCPVCGHDNRAQAKFCEECAAPLPRAQPDPRSFTPAPLAEKMRRQRPSEGERRIVTVLFVDAVGSTPLAEKLGEEQMYTLMREALSRMSEAVHAYEGHVATFTGDGMMALFGAPIAHEDSARRAVAAALRMQSALDQYGGEIERRHGVDCRFRVGLNTGPVVVGTVTDDLRMDFTAIGDTVNLAARMEQVADPGSVLVSEHTQRAIADFFECDPLGDFAVKGKPDPVPAWRVVKERAVRTRFQAAAERGLSPLVGRDRELALLTSYAEGARQGNGGVVFVSGEAGIGKSRLILELRHRVEGEVRWLEGRCVSYGRNTPYLPLVELLKATFGVAEDDDDGAIIRKVDDAVAGWAEPSQQRVPYLKFVLSVDPGDGAVLSMDPLERRVEIFEALGTLLAEESRQRPLVVAVEDLHWADQMSNEALESVMALIPTIPVLLLLTHRPDYESPQDQLVVLQLEHLDQEESHALTRGVLGAEALSPEIHQLITLKAEGNPFYIEEVAKAFVEAGVVELVGGHYRLRRSIEQVQVPGTIQEVILSRIDRLERDAKEAMQLASVVGREFTARVLDRISGLEAQLSEVLGDLTALQLILETARVPELAYMFKHALIHDVAYATLVAESRQRLHRLVGAAIEELYADRLSEHYETLAHHCYEGQDWEKALGYLEKAGDKAVAAYANADALRFYARALEVCETLGEPAVEASVSSATKRALVNFGVGDLPAAIADLDRVVEAGRRLGSRSLEGIGLGYRGLFEVCNHDFERGEATLYSAWAVVGEGFEEVRPLASMGLGLSLVVSNRWAEVEPLLAYMELVPDMPDPITEGMWNWAGGLIAYYRGHFDEALRILDGLSESAERIVTIRLYNWWVRGMALASRGEYDAALAELHKTLAMAERVGDWQVRPRVVNTVGWVFAELEDHEQAQSWNRQGVELAGGIPGLPDPEIEMNARLNLGDNLAALGRPDEAAEQFKKVETVVRNPTPPQRWLLWRYSLHLFHSYGELWLEGGEPATALAYADECIALAEHSSSMKYVVKGRRLRGQSLVAEGRLDEAEQELCAALDIAVAVGNPPQLWKTHAAIGDLRRTESRPGDARRAYGEALLVIEEVARSLTDAKLRETFLQSGHVQGIRRAAEARS